MFKNPHDLGQVAVEQCVKIKAFPSSSFGFLLQFSGKGCTSLGVAGVTTENVAGDNTGHLGKNGLRPANNTLK